MSGGVSTYLLDQNFPTNVVRAFSDFMPPHVALVHVPEIDPRLSDASDRDLIIWASQNGFSGLVSMNHKMVNQPGEVAAMVATKLTMVLTKKMGHNPLRASGALFLELPSLHQRVRPGVANVFMLGYEPRVPQDAWEHLSTIANRQGMTASDLWSKVRPSADEMAAELLARD